MKKILSMLLISSCFAHAALADTLITVKAKKALSISDWVSEWGLDSIIVENHTRKHVSAKISVDKHSLAGIAIETCGTSDKEPLVEARPGTTVICPLAMDKHGVEKLVFWAADGSRRARGTIELVIS